LIRNRASAIDRNQEAFRYSCRSRLLNASMKALSLGLPGLEKSVRRHDKWDSRGSNLTEALAHSG
jgi:hypothetical protein